MKLLATPEIIRHVKMLAFQNRMSHELVFTDCNDNIFPEEIPLDILNDNANESARVGQPNRKPIPL